VNYFAWTLTTLLMLTGFAGTVLPLLPGTLLIFAVARLHKLLLPASLSWTAVVVLAVMWLLSLAVDVLCTVATTRWFGGSKWGMAGAGAARSSGCSFRCRH
jgi:uncharacterized protein YqgC (DUF456 family)